MNTLTESTMYHNLEKNTALQIQELYQREKKRGGGNFMLLELN